MPDICAYGHGSGYSGKHCLQCNRIAGKKYRDKNRDTLLVSMKKWREENRAKAHAFTKAWNELNPGRKNATTRAWNAANADQVKENFRIWKIKNPGVMNAHHAKRRSAKLEATPPWADLAAIEKVYRDCAFLSFVTASEYHVDHIVPLQGKKVCGLHVPWNLQILTAEDNKAKNNKFVI